VSALFAAISTLCNDFCKICGVSLQMGVAGNAPTVAAVIAKQGKCHRKMGEYRCKWATIAANWATARVAPTFF